jgi:hypothetical protein
MQRRIMFQRVIKLPERDSFFLFGARGVGKSTLVRKAFPATHTIDLLDPVIERDFHLSPGSLTARLRALPPGPQTVVIDEIQKLPVSRDRPTPHHQTLRSQT